MRPDHLSGRRVDGLDRRIVLRSRVGLVPWDGLGEGEAVGVIVGRVRRDVVPQGRIVYGGKEDVVQGRIVCALRLDREGARRADRGL